MFVLSAHYDPIRTDPRRAQLRMRQLLDGHVNYVRIVKSVTHKLKKAKKRVVHIFCPRPTHRTEDPVYRVTADLLGWSMQTCNTEMEATVDANNMQH